MAFDATGAIEQFDKTHAANLIVKTDKPDMRAFYNYLLSIGALDDPEVTQFLEESGLTEEYGSFISAQTAEPSELEQYLETADPRDPNFFSTIESAGFDALKTIEYRRPDLVVKVQSALEASGQYVTDENHRFYRDGKIGREETSVTWYGIQSAANKEPTHSPNIASANYATDIDRLKTQININTHAGTIGPVGGKFTTEQAHALMATLDQATIGRAAMRILKDTLSEAELGNWVKDTPAASILEYVNKNPEFSSNFDYESGTATAQTLMEFIRLHEAGGSYDVAWNHQTVVYKGEVRQPTDMTVGEVLDWQENYCRAASCAIGGYQFMDFTLREYAHKAGVSLDTQFTPEIQDKIALTILVEKRGMGDYLDGKISPESFINKLAHEWAILPKDQNGGAYDHTALNKANTGLYGQLHAIVTDMRDNYQRDQNPTIALNNPEPATANTSAPTAPPMRIS